MPRRRPPSRALDVHWSDQGKDGFNSGTARRSFILQRFATLLRRANRLGWVGDHEAAGGRRGWKNVMTWLPGWNSDRGAPPNGETSFFGRDLPSWSAGRLRRHVQGLWLAARRISHRAQPIDRDCGELQPMQALQAQQQPRIQRNSRNSASAPRRKSAMTPKRRAHESPMSRPKGALQNRRASRTGSPACRIALAVP